MPSKIHRLRLTDAEREDLKSLANRGRATARKQTHARILLLCDEGRAGHRQRDGGAGAAALRRELRCILPPPQPPITRSAAVGPTICLASG